MTVSSYPTGPRAARRRTAPRGGPDGRAWWTFRVVTPAGLEGEFHEREGYAASLDGPPDTVRPFGIAVVHLGPGLV